MDSVTALFLNFYDLLSSSWVTLEEEQRLGILMIASGVLALLLLALRARGRVLARRRYQTAQTTIAAVPATEVPATGWLGGLSKTRRAFGEKLQELFSGRGNKAELFERLEELLITSDLGVKTTALLLSRLRSSEVDFQDASELKRTLHREIRQILESEQAPEIVPMKKGENPLVIAVVGVNGVGKTTTIGKLAWQFGAQGAKVLIAAGDTFRAAAEQQLRIWAERAGAEIVTGADNAKPSTVVFEALQRASRERFDVVLIDTAGRLHTRVNLMNELQKIIQLIGREIPGAPHETILVVDASTGQNALQQAVDFNACAPLSGIVITKLDGTPKGGIVVAIKNEIDVPIRYVGIGEQATDLKLFSAEEFTDALFAVDQQDSESANVLSNGSVDDSPRKVVRRNRTAA
jgi:fused signal recognition particle receptor